MGLFDKVKNWFKDTPSNYNPHPLYHGIGAIPPGAIVLTRSKGSFVGYMIRKLTKGWTNHFAIYFGSGKHELVEALPDGTKKTRLDDYLNKDAMFKVFVKRDLTVEQLTKIKEFAYACVGKPYDYKGLFGFPFKLGGDSEKFFCSEEGVLMFNAARIQISNKPANQTAPDDIEDFLLSERGVKDNWILWDTYNVKA